MGPTTRHSPRKATTATSPEGAPLLPNPNIDPTTSLLRISEAEKRMIEEILGKRKKRSPTKDLEEETDEEPPTKGRRTSKDLVAKKCTSGGVSGTRRGRSRKVGYPLPQVWVKRCPHEKILTRHMWEEVAILQPGDFHMAWVIIPLTHKAIHLINMGEECSGMMKNKQ